MKGAQPSASPVIVVEDSDEDFDTVVTALRTAGLPNALRRATSGEVLLGLLRGERGEPVEPAFVLLDLNTPGVDGRDALCALRADPRWRALPVVVLSTSANPKDLAFCYEHGANAYHVKPVRHVDHLEMLGHVLDYWLRRTVLPRTEPGGA